jgi:HPt (histidine-containing phosphotransfer) domain-containing protein
MEYSDDRLSIFDLDDALEKMGGDKEILADILEVFSETYADQLNALKKAIEDSNATMVERAAHTLKGSVGAFSAKKALDTALRLENMGHDGNLEEAATEFSKLEQEVEELHIALKQALSES